MRIQFKNKPGSRMTGGTPPTKGNVIYIEDRLTPEEAGDAVIHEFTHWEQINDPNYTESPGGDQQSFEAEPRRRVQEHRIEQGRASGKKKDDRSIKELYSGDSDDEIGSVVETIGEASETTVK